jgi:hypothetical protein
MNNKLPAFHDLVNLFVALLAQGITPTTWGQTREEEAYDAALEILAGE